MPQPNFAAGNDGPDFAITGRLRRIGGRWLGKAVGVRMVIPYDFHPAIPLRANSFEEGLRVYFEVSCRVRRHVACGLDGGNVFGGRAEEQATAFARMGGGGVARNGRDYRLVDLQTKTLPVRPELVEGLPFT
ncbi:hypothetical protein HME9302_00431 [Alteripontixanthobacter maritimus]|uniref:Uncharacterized protein n=1 Tax=Alteripontixanthobacter maritimus TaxID=2161824 RepID=A0A369Q3A3_9SPHN|nr:hypothetical protein HME9302_00431 [Alteripontixanthobacter maritimus]